MGYVLFDVETELTPGDLNLDRHVPGITIAASLTGEGDLQLWYERDPAGQPTGNVLGKETAVRLVHYLQQRALAGDAVVTWNGAGFDFRVLAKASGLYTDCVALAWDHVDMMFWLHCQKGFSVALQSAARAVGTGKVAGLSGADAPRLWAAGAYEQVQQYVAQDVRAAAAVYEAATRTRNLCWINTQGRLLHAAGPLCSVRDAYALALPDTSWMRRGAWPREKFVGWMLAHG